jgi:hypothetical protein
MLKSFATALLAAALMTAAGMSITSPAQAQARLAWWGWPRLVAAPGYATAYGYYPGYGYGYGTGYNYPAYAYGYGAGYGYPASGYYSSSGGYGMWENPWYSAASHPFIRRHVPLLARAARHWQ